MTLSTRIGVMNDGEIIQVGEPPQIYEHPNSRFVADFIGSVNLFEGRVAEDMPDFIRIAVPELGGAIHVGHGVSCSTGQQLWYAVRPEKMQLTRQRPEGRKNAFEVEVLEIAYMGNLSVYRVKLPGGKLLSATKANLSRHEEDQISWDETVWASWDDTAGVVLTR